jgi:hypothetical protein
VRIWLALIAGAVLCSPASASGVRHVVEIASSGPVQARFSYDYAAPARFSNERLMIKRARTVVVDQPIRPIRYGAAWPANYWNHRASVVARDLDGDGEPEVFLDLYWGGAHCCWYTQVYWYGSAAGRYALRTQVWGNPAMRTVDLDHDRTPEFVSGDNRFAYRFTDFADSSWPVQIWVFRSGAFGDVTRRFPAAIRKDAQRQWRVAFSRGSDGILKRGVLAAWTADECLLAHCKRAFHELEALRQAGKLAGRKTCPCDPSARAYLVHLRRFLRRTGYVR